ncbi:MAG: helix-turn-helix domain-containing protein [Clostridia bacterium]|nr:helix-turn-helix domain-containing protein [Clostridia bacterium]
MENQKKQMAEAAVLYYEKKCTQQEIATLMGLSRQTVSKLLTDAVKENVVEIKINNPDDYCRELEREITEKFGIKRAVVSSVSTKDETVRRVMTVRKATEYLKPIIEKGGQNVGISWGRTIKSFIDELSDVDPSDNTVFPLFGATDQEESFFLSNELARSFADKTGAKVKYAWFPYLPDSIDDKELFKKTSYYEKISQLWENIDLAIVGIGNSEMIGTFGKVFGYTNKSGNAVGDISTHFFNGNGEILELYENTLCASKENLKNAKNTVAIACLDDKTDAIKGALRTGIINTLITDEYTARRILLK